MKNWRKSHNIQCNVGGTQPCGWHGMRLWFEWPLKVSLVTSTTTLEIDKSNGRSTWSQYNYRKYAGLSSLTYHHHYPTLETEQEYQVKFKWVILKASLIPLVLRRPAPNWTRLLAGTQMKGTKQVAPWRLNCHSYMQGIYLPEQKTT